MRTERLFKDRFSPKHFLFILAGCILLMFSSCEVKPDFIGRDILPSGDDFTVSFDSMEIITGFTHPADSMPISFKENHFLGSITEDYYFGKSRAEIITTISSSSTSKGFGSHPVADSVILSLAWTSLTGEGSMPQEILLYEYAELLQSDTTYYTGMDLTGKYRQPEIGSVMASKGDSIIRIHITDQEFIDKFLTADDSILSSTSYLQKLIYGLYLTTGYTPDNGYMFNINFNQGDNNLYFYYHNDSVAEGSQNYSLGTSANGHLNLFRHDASGYPLDDYLNNGSENDSLIFIQSLAGVYSVIRFPGLTEWIDSMPVAINEARLIIPVADTLMTMQHRKDFPEKLNLYIAFENGKFSPTYDYILDGPSFGGDYKKGLNYYAFTMKVQMQSIIAKKIDNLDIVIRPASGSSRVSRAILCGWNIDPRKRMRLEITYTLL